jgi:hypothetical protein
VPGHGDSRGDRRRGAKAFDVALHACGRVEDGVVEQPRLLDADPLGVALAERVVGKRARPAL